MKKLYCVICDGYRKFEKPKKSYFLEKHWFFLLFAVITRMKMKNYLKKKNQLKYQKFLVYNYFKNMIEENIHHFFFIRILFIRITMLKVAQKLRIL